MVLSFVLKMRRSKFTKGLGYSFPSPNPFPYNTHFIRIILLLKRLFIDYMHKGTIVVRIYIRLVEKLAILAPVVKKIVHKGQVKGQKIRSQSANELPDFPNCRTYFNLSLGQELARGFGFVKVCMCNVS